MKKTRAQKGITLIALIITIVVLLILAVVAINAVTGDGIIQHATNARDLYENAQAKEQGILSYYEAYLDAGGTVGKWAQKEETKKVTYKTTNSDGESVDKTVEVKVPSSTITKVNSDGTVQEIKIGSYVNYNPTKDKEGNAVTASYTSVGDGNTLVKDTNGNYIDQTFNVTDYTGKWKVLGIENGKILLVSESNIKSYEMNSAQQYIIGETELNNICAIYGKGKGAETARSIKVEDVNKITGYNPELFDYNSDEYGEYGVTTTFTTDGTNLLYSMSKGKNGQLSNNALSIIVDNQWCEEELNDKETYTVTNTIYSYAGIDKDGYIDMDMKTESNEFKLIFIGSGYWLASRVTATVLDAGDITTRILYGLRLVSGSSYMCGFSGAYGGAQDTTFNRGVRPVVVLDANADLVLSSDGTSYDIELGD